MSFKVKVIALVISVLVLLTGIPPLMIPTYAAIPSELASKVDSPASQGFALNAQRGGNLPRFNIGGVPNQAVWNSSSCEFLIHWDEAPHVFFNATTDPQPIGDMILEPSSPPDWHFIYIPDSEDKRSFTVTITATTDNESVSQSFEITPMQKLVPEQTIFHTGEHTKPVVDPPNPEIPQVILKENPNQDINYTNTETLSVTVVGDTVVFEEDHESQLYNMFDYNKSGTRNIKDMKIIAEEVIIRDQLHLPQTNVSIWARTLRFEGDAWIKTTPVEKTTPAAPCVKKDETPGEDGADGLDAGNITLNLGDFVPSSSVELTFDLRGGKGQDAGEGAHGDEGNDMDGWDIFEWTDTGIDFSWTAPEDWRIVYEVAYCTCLFGAPIKAFDDGDKDGWPRDGTNAVPPGKPGEGGKGGVLTSNVLVTPNQLVGGGNSGTAAKPPDGYSYYHGGSAGWPQKALRMKANYCLKASFSELGRNESTDGKDEPVKHALALYGTPGEYKPEGEPYSWLHPLLLNRVFNRAKDDYLSDRIEQAEARLKDYVAILDSYKNDTSWDDLELLSEMNRFELEQIYNEMQILLHRIESDLDYFGNPAGWVPMLSFEVLQGAFRDEIEPALRQIYFAYWIKKKAEQKENAVEFLKAAREELMDQTEEAKTAYDKAIEDLPILENKLGNLRTRTQELQSQLRVKETELVNQSRENLRPPAWEVGLRMGAKTAATICTMIPVYQPELGSVGKGLRLASNFDPEKPWDMIIGSSDVGTAYFDSKYKNYTQDMKEKKELFAIKDREKQDAAVLSTEIKKGLGAMRDASAGLSEGLKDMRNYIAEFEAPQDEIDAELERLKGESAEWKELVEKIEDILADRQELVGDLVTTMQEISSLSNLITQNLLAMDAMNQQIIADEIVLSERVTAYLDNMERRAYDRLLKFHYYMAKAYEYRLLQNYTTPLDFEGLMKELQELAAWNEGDHQLSDDEASLFATVYEDLLREITFEILNLYNDTPPGSSRPIRFELSPQEIEDLNKGKPVTINLMEREPRPIPLNRENVRILSIEIDADNPEMPGLIVHSNPEGGSYGGFAELTILMEHSGLSKLVKDGQIYQFMHYTERTKYPIRWGATYDAIVDVLNPIEPSKADGSLLCALLGDLCNNEDVLLYSRPAAWADIVLSKEVNTGTGIDIVIDSLRLKVTYDYIEAKPVETGKVKLQVLTSEAGLMPYFVIDKADENGRQDGRGSFLRTYPNGSWVTAEAPTAYGEWQFERWTDRYGKDLGDKPTNPVLELKLDDDQTVVAQMSQSVSPPKPTESTSTNWWLIGSIIAVVVAGLASYLLLRRKRKV